MFPPESKILQDMEDCGEESDMALPVVLPSSSMMHCTGAGADAEGLNVQRGVE